MAADPMLELNRRIAQLIGAHVERRLASERASWVAAMTLLVNRNGGEVRFSEAELLDTDLTTLDAWIDQATGEVVYHTRQPVTITQPLGDQARQS
jgi:hypothetical protein